MTGNVLARLVLVLVLASACGIPGARFFKGDGGGSDTPGDEMQLGPLRHGYIVDESAAGGIYRVDKDTAGRITLASPTPVQTGASLFALASRDGKRLYVLDGGDASLREFQIAPDGNLLQAQSIPLPCKSAFAALHPNGNFVAFACSGLVGLLNLSQLQINSFNVGTEPAFPAFTPDGNCLFVTDFSASATQSVLRFTVNATTGELGGLGPAPGPPGSRGIAVHPDGQLAYVAGLAGATPQLQGYAIANGCNLTSLATPVAPPAQPTSVLVDPAGTRLFITGGGVSVYDIRLDGTLTIVPGSPFFTGLFIVGSIMDPAQPGSVYLTTNTGTIQGVIEPNGMLTMGSRADTGSSMGRWFALAL